jgi:hypothetical protein
MIQTLADLKVTYIDPIPLHCDNTSAISVSKNLVLHSNTNNILIKYHFLKEKVTNRVVQLNYIPSKDQIVDIFTKPLATAQFEYLRHKLGVTLLSSSNRLSNQGEYVLVEYLIPPKSTATAQGEHVFL